MAILAQAARLLAKSTAIVGYRGVGRLFKPLRRVAALRSVTGEVPLGGTRRIRFGAFDYYWAGFLWTGKPYEEDVQRVFDRLAHIPDKLFVDGGANIGYWTVKLSEPGYGYRRFIAVEANPEVFTYLQRNMALNAVDGVAVHAAIAERAGEIVRLGGAADHASASVGAEGLPVTTASVASLLQEYRGDLPGGTTAIVKLDVEGSEIAAIRGSEGGHGFDLVFVFEDWPRSGMTVVEHLLQQGYKVAGIDEGGKACRIESVEQAVKFNQETTRSYGPSNLIASRQLEKYLPEI